MKYILALLLLTYQSSFAQRFSKADKKIVASLKTHINYLADDKLEGRRTGTAGEKLAYEYITGEFKNAGINPIQANGNYLQEFDVPEGKQINKETFFSVNDHSLILKEDFFPLAYSANASVQCDIYQSLKEQGEVWFFDIGEPLTNNSNNPHFDLQEAISKVSTDYSKKGATGLVIYNSSSIADNIKFDEKDKTASSKIPVVYLNIKAKKKYLADETSMHTLKLKVNIEEKKRIGHNVIGFINNNSATTIIIGAHYDHLGYGEDHNSLYAGTTPMIHNGADDNASGTAALIELGKILRSSKLKKNNYLLIAFSGEELGLFGSKYFTDHPSIDLSTVDYMINMDMVGRLNDSTHGLNIGGYGTSPAWNKMIDTTNKYFKIKLDSSGTGPSDHTSFYRKDIPVLFFFTGTHMDYHKPSDDADKINYSGELQVIKFVYNIIKSSGSMGRFAFTKTRETSTGKNTFKVSLGIMPDYTFSGNGVHVDGVSAGRPAEKAGIKVGDVLVQLGENKFSDVQTYMDALNKFNKGDATKVKLIRGKQELTLDIIF
ncbi:MAG: M28 family peptidase [Ferruginibacter sp.]